MENKMSNLLRLVACLTVLLSFNAFAVDTDGDGFSDADEAALGTDPNDPTSPLENKLTASDGAQSDYFGSSVSIDGDTAVIGADRDDDNGDYSGSAYVYIRSNGVWSEQAKLTASDGSEGDSFGQSVSIDGDTAVIGAHLNDNFIGSAYVYVRSNGVWSEQAKLTASDAASDDQFGYSVSIDGDTAVIGAWRDDDDDNGSDSGSAYVYVRTNGVWTEQQKLTASDGAYDDQFGISVSIDGDTAVIGAHYDDDNGSGSGSAYVYVRSNGVWSEQAKLTASDGAWSDNFGYSVSIDGDTAVIGAGYDDDNGNNSGSAYVYVRSNGVWSEQAKLTASDGPGSDNFGRSVSIDGDTAVIGARLDDDNGSDSGSAYVYVRSNGVWSEQQKLTASDGAANYLFGRSVSIDGDTAVIGAFADDAYTGSAYIFPLTPPSPPHQDTPAVITGSLDGNTTQGGFTFGTLQATDVDGLNDGTYFTVSNAPLYGQAQINPSTGLWTYLAEAIYVGADPFTVTVTDDLGGTTEQVVSITITAPDSDGDGTYDFQDNCPSVSNADQANLDGDAFGDACDSDIDGDGTDNAFDAFPNDATESADSDADNVGDNSDNCINDANADQANLDGDALGDTCDPDMDGDGVFNVVELRFGGNETDNTDASVSQNNIVTFSETAPADSDLDGVPDDYETAAGGDTTSSTFESVLAMLTTNKNVPAMGGIGLLALGLSMLSLGAVRLRRK
ncbi:thrombospondin type 3 repeat-containing protein [bacterium]|nr:thrombospondin type 3 repeat-containing protein [bacterium]